MNRWTAVRVAAIGALVLALFAPGSAALACDQNEWGLKAQPGDAQVTLTWNALPENATAKLVRWERWFPEDSAIGDSEETSDNAGSGDATDGAQALIGVASVIRPACWESEDSTPPVVVYQGSDASFVDTGVVNGVTYYYTLFVQDSSTGEYYEEASRAIATPGPADTVTTPTVSVAKVRHGHAFGVGARVSAAHTIATKAQILLYRKAAHGRWQLVRSKTTALGAGATVVKGAIATPTKGSYKVVVKHVGIGESSAASPPRYFWSH